MKKWILLSLFALSLQAAVPPGCVDVFPEVQKAAAAYHITVLPVENAPALKCSLPFDNPNTGGKFFYSGMVQDKDRVPDDGYRLKTEFFFDTPTNIVFIRLRDYLASVRRSPALTWYERLRAQWLGWRG